MTSVFKAFGRAASVLAVLTMLAAPAALAAGREDRDLGRKFCERAKQFAVIVFSRLGGPPG